MLFTTVKGLHRPQAPALRDRPGGHPRRGVHGRDAGPDRHRHQDLRRPLRRRLPGHRRRRARRRGLRRRHRSRGAAGPGRRVGARPTYVGCPASPRREGGVFGYARLVGKDGKALGNPATGAPAIGMQLARDTRAQPVPARRRARARRGRRGRHRRPRAPTSASWASATRRRSSSRARRGPCGSAASRSSARWTAPAAPPSRCSRRPSPRSWSPSPASSTASPSSPRRASASSR